MGKKKRGENQSWYCELPVIDEFLCLYAPWSLAHNLLFDDIIQFLIVVWLMFRIVRDVVEGPSQNLLESVAHLIANTTLLKFPQISAVRVKVGKPHVAVHGTIDYLGVEILRYKRNEKPEPLWAAVWDINCIWSDVLLFGNLSEQPLGLRTLSMQTGGLLSYEKAMKFLLLV